MRYPQSFPLLRALDLSSNGFARLSCLLDSLAPLGRGTGLGNLQQLQLLGNPCAVQPGGAGHAGPQPAFAAYRQAVLRRLPQLRELDGQPVDAQQSSGHPQAAPVWPARSTAAAEEPAQRAEWEARTVLWLLSHDGAVAELQLAKAQQQASTAASFPPPGGCQPVAPGAEGIAAVLHGMQRAAAAAAASSPGLASERASVGSDDDGAGSAGSGRQGVLRLRLAQALYLVLAAGEPASAQTLLLLNPTCYAQALSRLHAAAACVQAAWRRHAARRLRRLAAAERRAARAAAGAAAVQAAWRGWLCRHRTHAWVQVQLAAWRRKWREAAQQLLEHQQGLAAVCIQARAVACM